MAGNRKNRHVRHPRRVRLTRPALGKGNVHGFRRFPSGRWRRIRLPCNAVMPFLFTSHHPYRFGTTQRMTRSPSEERWYALQPAPLQISATGRSTHDAATLTQRAAKRGPLIVLAKASFDCAICAERMPRGRQPSGLNTIIRKEKTCRSLSETTMLNRLSAP